MVSMTNWDYQKVVENLEQFASGFEPNDPKERKRQRIVKAAAALFIRQGYRKTSVDQVAQRAGVAKGTVYLYFKNKSELLVQAIVEEKRRYISQVMPVFEQGISPRERLKRYLRTVLIMATQMPLGARLLSGDMEILIVLEEMDDDVRDKSFELGLDLVSELLARAVAPRQPSREELRERAQVILSFMYASGIFAQDQVRGSLSMERFSELLADMLVDGICESSPPEPSSKPKRRKT